MEAAPPSSAKANSEACFTSESCEECGSQLTYNSHSNESICDSCGLVSNCATPIEGLDNESYEANYCDQRAILRTMGKGASTTWDLDGKDVHGSRIRPEMSRRMRRLKTINRNSVRVKPCERRLRAFEEHLKPRLMELESDWTGETRGLYHEAKLIFLAVCGHMDLRKMRNSNMLRSSYPSDMKWDVLALILHHEWRRDPSPLAKKVSTSHHRYVARKSSPDVIYIVQQYNRKIAMSGHPSKEKTPTSPSAHVSGFVTKVFRAINRVFAPQNDIEFLKRYPLSPSLVNDERCDLLLLMVDTVASAHGVTIPRNIVLSVYDNLVLHSNYPMIWSPNRLRSCHLEVTYWLIRMRSPVGRTIPRTKLVNVIAEDVKIGGSVSKAPQKSWGSMARRCVENAMNCV